MSIESSIRQEVNPAAALQDLRLTLERLNQIADASSPSIASIRTLVLLRISELEAQSPAQQARQYN